MIESTYSCSSLVGFVSSNRRLNLPPYSCGEAEVQADALGVADVQIAVRLRRKPRVHAPAVLAGGAVGVDDLLDEIAGRLFAARLRRSRRSCRSWPYSNPMPALAACRCLPTIEMPVRFA